MRRSASQKRRMRAQITEQWKAVTEVQAMSPQELLRWVLAFATEDLTELDAGARDARGYRLRSILPRIPGLASSGAHPAGPMPDEQLAALQVEILRGIEALLGQGVWQIPVAGQVSLDIREPGSAGTYKGGEIRAMQPTRYHWGCQTDDPTTLHVLGVMTLLARYGDRLRACARCGRPFIAVKRQQYCAETACGQKTRDERKKTRKGA